MDLSLLRLLSPALTPKATIKLEATLFKEMKTPRTILSGIYPCHQFIIQASIVLRKLRKATYLSSIHHHKSYSTIFLP